MDVLIGKIGKSIKFNEDNHDYANGQEEGPLLYKLLAKEYPQHRFVMCGKSDIAKIRKSGENTDVIPNNIIDLFDGYVSKDMFPHEYVEKRLNELNIKPSLGIIYVGPVGTVNVPNVGSLTLEDEEAKFLLINTNYAGPVIHALNITQVPYFTLTGDPKYIPPRMRDLFNDEKVSISQCNWKGDRQRVPYYGAPAKELRTVKLKYVYEPIETNFLINETKIDWRNIKKSNKFIIGLIGGESRDEFMKEWILNGRVDLTNIKVYGKWADEFTTKYPTVFEDKSIKSVESEFLASRYTIIPPPHKPMKNFVTQKFWKMIHYGIIPFLHPKYDMDKILDVPDILRLKNKYQLWDRIEYLDNNPEEYQQVKNKLYDLLKDEYYDGRFLIDMCKNISQKYCEIEF